MPSAPCVSPDMCDVPVEAALTPHEAALEVARVAVDSRAFPGGHFYRHRRVIPW
jgi:hypothetical protein